MNLPLNAASCFNSVFQQLLNFVEQSETSPKKGAFRTMLAIDLSRT